MLLDPIVAATRDRLKVLQCSCGAIEDQVAHQAPALPAFQRLAATPRPAVIAEFKRRSPSRGDIAKDKDPVSVARAYQAMGARAVSCLTEPEFFAGSNQDFKDIRQALPQMPLLRKDFVLDPLQVLEARALGADICLLIVRILQDGLKECLQMAESLQMAALVEVHSEAELDLAVTLGARLIGINNRDLDTFAVDLETSERLLRQLPDGALAVSESGIKDADDAKRLVRAGAHALLIGESLMRQSEASLAPYGLP